MFIKLTSSGPRTYVQLVESFRDDSGKPRQRTLATLGRVDEADGQVDSLINALLRAKGRYPRDCSAPQIRFESALALGDVWALDELWRELGFDRLAGVFRKARYTTPVEQALRVMVFNRLCDPDSKLGVLRWLQTVRIPSIQVESLTHQQLLRSMDALMDHQSDVDHCVATLLRPLIDDELSVVFYDLTTIRTEGLSEQSDDVRQFGMSKDGVIARQFMLGVVQTADGLPIHHEVFAGNAAESPTLMPTLKTVLGRFPHVRRLVVVADRGLLSVDNIEQLSALTMPDGQSIEFILAVPGRRYADFEAILAPLQSKAVGQSSEMIEEFQWQGRRLVVAHNPIKAAEQTALRDERIAALERRASELVGKLDAQDEGRTWRGRKLSDSGAKACFFHEVCEAHLASIIRVDLKSDLFSYDIDQRALTRARLMDGKLLLVTNVADLRASEIVERYKALADIERGFRVLKSEIDIAPVYHRLPDRIRAHASLCFMALILYRVMRNLLRLACSDQSPEKVLANLRRTQHHTITIDDNAPISGVSTVTRDQANALAALKVKKPIQGHQLSLL
ncbi:MAG: IS1634 family transposase [Betaproteobacteria bacterium]